MVTVRTVAPGASWRAWAAWAAEWVMTAPARRSRARARATSPGRRSCGRTLWQMTTVRVGRRRPAMIVRYAGTWSGVSRAKTTRSAGRRRRPSASQPSGRYQASLRRVRG